jgi:hypothetical protein
MATRTSPTLTVRPYATTLFFSRGVHANDVISKQRDLDDFLYMKLDYRCVLLSYIMILQVNFRRRTVLELCGSREPCGTMKYDTPFQWHIIIGMLRVPTWCRRYHLHNHNDTIICIFFCQPHPTDKWVNA